MTQYNIVPGLMGVVLTMTMVMITALAVTRERERGTMESLLATPALPLEVMTGKIVPYILVGYVQVTLILAAAKLIFHVPMVGSPLLLYLCALCFIAATLAVGITISTLCHKPTASACRCCSSSSLSPRCYSPGSCFRSGACRNGPSSGQILAVDLISCGLFAGILLKGNQLPTSGPEIWPISSLSACVSECASDGDTLHGRTPIETSDIVAAPDPTMLSDLSPVSELLPVRSVLEDPIVVFYARLEIAAASPSTMTLQLRCNLDRGGADHRGNRPFHRLGTEWTALPAPVASSSNSRASRIVPTLHSERPLRHLVGIPSEHFCVLLRASAGVRASSRVRDIRAERGSLNPIWPASPMPRSCKSSPPASRMRCSVLGGGGAADPSPYHRAHGFWRGPRFTRLKRWRFM